MHISVLEQGYPARFTQGYLGWPTVVYVEHQGIKILVDTGASTQRHQLPDKLGALGASTEDIDMVLISHLHFDHVANYDLFPKARFLVHRAEVEHVEKNQDPGWAYHRYHYEGLRATGRMDILHGGEVLLPGVETLHAPGHTPGCLALILTDASIPTTIAAGDAVKNITELATAEVPMVTDAAQATRSIVAIRERAKVVIPGHDRVLHVHADHIEAVTQHHLDLVRVARVLPAGEPQTLPLGFGTSILPIRA